MIEINGISKSFKGVKILDNVSLTLPEGKITVVIGPSGTGKSVLLKNILGLLKPESGQILIDGHDISKMVEFQLNHIRKNFGVCFQDAALFDSMNVGNNVGFPFVIHTKMSYEEISAKVSELVKEVGLTGVEEKMPSQISGGMRKRVGLARALAMNPKFLLFDEPTTGLDPVMSNAIYALINEVQKKTKATSLMISHDIEGAFKLADHIIMLYKGKIVFEGTPEDFKTTDNPLVRQFVKGSITGPINPVE